MGFLNFLKRRLARAVLNYDFEVFEAFNALSTITWGVALLLPGEVFGRSSVYYLISQIASEMAWGATVLALGLAQLLALVHGKKNLRKEVALLMFALWVFVSIASTVSGSVTAMVAIYPIYAIFSFGNYYNLIR